MNEGAIPHRIEVLRQEAIWGKNPPNRAIPRAQNPRYSAELSSSRQSSSGEFEMHKLAEFAIKAHGGLARWSAFRTVSADLVQGGGFWGLAVQSQWNIMWLTLVNTTSCVCTYENLTCTYEGVIRRFLRTNT